jgi:hypothetical protein
VGGLGGEVRAETQDEAWAKFERDVRTQIEERFGLFLDAPLTRDAAFRKMWRDDRTGAWVLDYHFSK